MNKENIFLTLAAATGASIAMTLSLSWFSPVAMFGSGLIVFCTILTVGWHNLGVNRPVWANVIEVAAVWLWLAMLIWFALLSACFWLWILGVGMIYTWLTRPFACARS
ncbi:MAG: hypothetical protein JST01_16990 [Cyanobacteria bacterium SZAS TMP-1]|nr:hypothetical protein [Cyanobacteria bacterium SZAS TMP-1]